MGQENGSKNTDPWEIVADHEHHACDKCGKEKSAKEFVIHSSKYNPKLSRVCKMIIVKRKMKDACELSIQKNVTGMGI